MSARALLEGLGVPAREMRRRVNGVTLHVVEAGPEDGPPVLLLHGFPEFWWGWRKQIPGLAGAGFRVVVPDQRGYNTSSKPPNLRDYDLDTLANDVIGLIESCGCERAHLVGHDWGGLVAWWAASRHPDRIARLAILNAPHPAVGRDYLRLHPSQIVRSAYIAFFQLPWLPEVVLSRRDYGAMRQALTRSSRRGTVTDAELDIYAETWREPGALTAMLNWYRALRRRPAMANPRLEAPTLVIWGVRDAALEVGLAYASLALCRDGRLVRIEDATHWVHLEAADRVTAEIAAFLRESIGPESGIR